MVGDAVGDAVGSEVVGEIDGDVVGSEVVGSEVVGDVVGHYDGAGLDVDAWTCRWVRYGAKRRATTAMRARV